MVETSQDPESASGKRVNRRIELVDADGGRQHVFEVGDSIFVSGHGLKRSAPYEFVLATEPGDTSLLARYTTDRHGALPVSLLIPYAGIVGPDLGRHPVIEAKSTSSRQARSLSFNVREGSAPRVLSTDRLGRLQTGIEDEGTVGVTLRHFPAGCVRVTLVNRQFGWRVGDPVEPALDRRGRPLVTTTSVTGDDEVYVSLGGARMLRPGSYQFVARPYRPGWFDADALRLRPGDVVSDRRFASLVVRSPLTGALSDGNGVVLTPQVAGRPLAHRPYFQFLDNFPIGTDVFAALDPDHLPSGLVGTRAAIYVIAHKSAAGWAASSSLADITGPGMTPNPKVVPIVPGCINWNATLVWPNPQVPGLYDIAIDFGNNDPTAFAADGSLDAPLDMIDGYVRVGFYVTQDPSLPGPFSGSVGRHDYALPSISVPSTDGGPTPTDMLPLTATIRYPATASGVDAAFAPGVFPVVIVMHGNSGMETSYLGYDYLLDHLAGHGFIAASIYAPVGAFIETRARAIIAHIGILSQANAAAGLFHGHVDLGSIGMVGHSRGGEAVVRAARINSTEGLGLGLKAAIAIAPTDYHHYGAAGLPLAVIYGANDGDVAGTWPDRTGFDILDETGRPRSFVFVYGATHDRFNTEWASIEASTELTWHITAGDVPNLISMTAHEQVAKGYVTAFVQAHLQGRDEQMAYFRDGLKPSLASAVTIHTTHQEAAGRTLDDFEETPHDPGSNTLGGAVVGTSLVAMTEDALHTLDVHSPHVTGGTRLAWQSSPGIYLSDVPVADRDLSGFKTLAFRVTQRYGSALNPTGQTRDFAVRLNDGGGRSRAIRVSTFTEVPFPYVRGEADLIKSALKTVRIPLASFAIANLGADDVDLHDVASVAFLFDAGSSGDIEIDDLEFSS